MAKAERKSTVHRRVPLDLIVVPIYEGKKITGIGVHAGLWTSQALIQPTEEVPMLRRRLKELDKEYGFDPHGHSGKALRHAVASVPRDLLVNLSEEGGRDLVTMAMPADNWERLLAAGLLRDFEQLRIDFLSRIRGEEPDESVNRWVERNPKRIAQFRALVDRARVAGTVSAPMLAQIASQARILLSR